MRPDICEQACTACGTCVEVCPEGVLDIACGVARTVQEDACTGCGVCVDQCPTAAICIDEECQPSAAQAIV
jgi:NAD-dependent dihydropyrimidine dehydrogenase PreA subunit